VIAAVLLAVGAALIVPRTPRRWPSPAVAGVATDGPGLVARGRAVWSACALVGATLLVPGPLGLGLGTAGAAAVWVVVGRAEPASERRRRASLARELPHLVDLIAAALEAGLAVSTALELATAALPGAAAEELRAIAAQLRLGVSADEAWGSLTPDAELAPLGRAMARAHSSGASVAHAARLLADDLTDRARLRSEDRARTVGVRAAVPLGLCLLPGFILLGVVPMVVSAAGAIKW